MTERIAVFGGEGDMGRQIVTHAQRQGHETLVVDPRSQQSADPEKALGWATIVYLSLFPKVLLEVLDGHGQSISNQHLVLENTSTKRTIIPRLKELNEKGVSVCSVHPLAKHDQPPQGQKVLIMSVGQNSQKATQFAESFYDKLGMIIIHHSLEEHDSMMMPEQLPFHAVRRAELLTYKELGYPFSQLWNLAPANAELALASIARTAVQKPNISASIICNYLQTPEGKAWKKAFMASLEDIFATAEKGQEQLAKLLAQTNQYLEEDGMDIKMNEATTIILERNANLRLQSLQVHAPEDKPGVLATIASVFAENGINLTAIDNRPPNGGVTLMIGVDRNTDQISLNQVIIRLKELGFILQENSPNN